MPTVTVYWRTYSTSSGNLSSNSPSEPPSTAYATSANAVDIGLKGQCVPHRTSFISNSTLLRRLWWIVAFAVSVYFCFKNLRKIYDNPIVITATGELTSITTLPYPAITVCSETKLWPDYLKKQGFSPWTRRTAPSIWPEIE